MVSFKSRNTGKVTEKLTTTATDNQPSSDNRPNQLKLPETYTGPNVDKFANDLRAAENGIVVPTCLRMVSTAG